MIASRRLFLTAGVAFVAAPSIVRLASLMPVSVLKPPTLQRFVIGPVVEASDYLTATEVRRLQEQFFGELAEKMTLWMRPQIKAGDTFTIEGVFEA